MMIRCFSFEIPPVFFFFFFTVPLTVDLKNFFHASVCPPCSPRTFFLSSLDFPGNPHSVTTVTLPKVPCPFFVVFSSFLFLELGRLGFRVGESLLFPKSPRPALPPRIFLCHGRFVQFMVSGPAKAILGALKDFSDQGPEIDSSWAVAGPSRTTG